jgi:hypothetical protein
MEELVFVALVVLMIWGWPVVGVVVGAVLRRSRSPGKGGAFVGSAVGLAVGLACTALCYYVVVPALNRAWGPM